MRVSIVQVDLEESLQLRNQDLAVIHKNSSLCNSLYELFTFFNSFNTVPITLKIGSDNVIMDKQVVPELASAKVARIVLGFDFSEIVDEFKDSLPWLKYTGELTTAHIGLIFTLQNGERVLSELIFNTGRVFMRQQNTALVKFKKGDEYIISDPKAFARILMIVNKVFQNTIVIPDIEKAFRFFQTQLNAPKLLSSMPVDSWRVLLREVSAKLFAITGQSQSIEYLADSAEPFVVKEGSGVVYPLFTNQSPSTFLSALLVYYFYKNKTTIKPSLIFIREIEQLFEEKWVENLLKLLKEKKSQLICTTKSNPVCRDMFQCGFIIAK